MPLTHSHLKKTTARPAASFALHVSLLLLVLGTTGTHVVDATPEFPNRIPNGFNVVGLNGEPWYAVGHGVPFGSATSFNQFGLDFKAAGLEWTVDLCQQDSDGDGMTNGEELGDPDCVWEVGATPSRLTNISHPGFANTVNGTTSNETVAGVGSTEAAGTSAELRLPWWLITHIVCMMLSWGFFLPIGALMAISFRGTFNSTGGKSGGTQLWFKLHVAIQILGLVLSIAGFVVIFMNSYVHFKQTHQMFGVVIFSFGLAQGMMGFVRPHKPAKGEEPTTLRTGWEYCHKGFGRIVIILAWVNIFLGVKLVKSGYGGLPAGSTDAIYMGMNAILGIQAALCLILTAVAILYRNNGTTTKPSNDGNGKEEELGGSSQMNTTVRTGGHDVEHDLEDQ